jgi:VanZ family protein
MPEGGFWQSDKLIHGLVYGILSLLFYRALGRYRTGRSAGRVRLRAAGLAILAAGLYGLSDEWHQSFVPGRSDSGLDLLADVAGAVIFVAVAYLGGQSRQNSARS